MPPLRDSGAGPEAERPEYAGQYRLEARLGSGGMGVVHLARSSSGLRLAVKVVHAEFAQDPEFRGRFRQEVAAARRVSGAFTAPVVDADPNAERPWMATLYIPGPTLSEHVKRKGPLAPDEVRKLAAGLAEALRDIHRAGVVHRDLKPGNVLLAADGPKVIDFGISRPSDSEMRTETGKLIGTPPFMAPEQFQRPREVGPAADVFALGSVLVHAATGSGPFDSESPYLVAYQVVHDDADLTGVPEELAPLIESCLAKDPADRPTPGELMELLHTEIHTEIHLAADLGLPGPATSPSASADPSPSATADPSPSSSVHPPASASSPVPAQRQPAGGDVAPPPAAETTHVRPHTPRPADRPDSPKAHQSHQAPTDAVRPARRAAAVRRWPIWAAVALLIAGGGAFVGVRTLSSGSSGLEIRTPGAGIAVRPWHATVLERPRGHRSEMPFCTAGSGAVYCTLSGLRAGRFDAETGRASWRRSGKAVPLTDTTPTAPVLSGGLLYLRTPDGRRLEALDPSAKGKGATRWSQELSRYEGGAAVVGNRVLLCAGDGTVTALDSATHRQRWRKRYPAHTPAAFFSYGDARTAYAVGLTADSKATQVTAIATKDGAVRWDKRLPDSLTPAGVGASGALYFTAADPLHPFTTTAVVRYDPHTGRQRRIRLDYPLDGTVTAAVQGETVYLLAEGGALQAVGERKWNTETSVSRGSTPVISGDHLYFTAADGRLLAVDTRSGAVLGQTPPRLSADRHNGYLESLPAPVVDARHGRIYAAAPDGTVFSTDTKDPAGW
ncbi:serine/threonine-protein kinase [Streptomyces gilvosporeus]|uniref:Serine/threonine protein kinase n=1 Tax=Streptomyces gilvosporeus TaxID=553510 RepID=A0A1V0TV03_9ACTN|nr:serine/threonine-protein kinase [Streptomyces gilvosporeus]ARF56785.1 serine/threonine protein kinase [Streptomyces gilvosporeus]